MPSSHSEQLLSSTSRLLTVPLCLFKLRRGNQSLKGTWQTLSRALGHLEFFVVLCP